MRQTNWRFVIVGGVMIGLAVVFFIVMGAMAPQSTDPAALMSTDLTRGTRSSRALRSSASCSTPAKEYPRIFTRKVAREADPPPL